MQNTIEFSGPSDRRTGFLSNESKHSFILDEKRWPSVEHYVRGKMFHGTLFEEEIRKTPNVFQIKQMTRPQSRRKTDPETGELLSQKETVYGKGKFLARRDWDDIRDDLLEEAMRAKFEQNPRLQERLVETGTASLADDSDPRTGPILEAIRTEIDLSEMPSEPKKIRLRDIRDSELSPQDSLIVFKYLEAYDVLHSIRETTKALVPKKLRDESKRYITEVLSVPWTDVFQKMPNYVSLTNRVGEIVRSHIPRIEQGMDSAVISNISAFLMWVKNGLKKEEQNKVFSHIKKYEPKAVKRVRFSVEKEPKDISRKDLKREKKNILELLRSEEDAGQLTARQVKKLYKKRFRRKIAMSRDEFNIYLISIIDSGEHLKAPKGKLRKVPKKRKSKSRSKAPPTGLEVVEKKGPTFDVWGESLKEFAPELLAIGGHYPKKKIRGRSVLDKSRIRFQNMYREDVEKIIFKSLPDQEKYFQAYEKWVQEKILDFVDMAIQLSALKDVQEVDEETIQIAVEGIYGCSMKIDEEFELEFDYTPIIEKVLSKSKAYSKYSLTEGAQQRLSQYIERLGAMLVEPVEAKKFLRGEETPVYELFRERLQDLRDWVDTEAKQQEESYGSLEPLQVFIIRALSHISSVMNKYDNMVSYNVCTRAFLALLPPGFWRQGALPYVESIIEDIEDGMDHQEIEEILSSHGIEFKLEDIKVIAAGHMEDKILSDTCLVVFATALHYLSPSLRKKQYDWLLRRVKKLSDVKMEGEIKVVEM